METLLGFYIPMYIKRYNLPQGTPLHLPDDPFHVNFFYSDENRANYLVTAKWYSISLPSSRTELFGFDDSK